MEKFEEKMQAAGLSQAAVDAFRLNYEQLVAGVTGLVSQSFNARNCHCHPCLFLCARFMPVDLRSSIFSQVPEKEIEAIDELPYLADLKSKSVGDVKVRHSRTSYLQSTC